jgi:hypothetical protein
MTNWKDKYDWIHTFYEGRAKVVLNNKWGFIDKDGSEVIPLKYDWVSNFYEGRAEITFMRCDGEIDLDGREYFSQEDLAKLRKYRLSGIIKSL